jgi:hypothetical protein
MITWYEKSLRGSLKTVEIGRDFNYLDLTVVDGILNVIKIYNKIAK